MLRLLERRIETLHERLVLLAPVGTQVPRHFCNVTVDPGRHRRHLEEVQRVRGGIYLRDGAVRREQLSDGLHRTPEDARSWHFLMFRHARELSSCVWYHEHDSNTRFEQLRAFQCPLRTTPAWREPLARAIGAELSRAQQQQLSYAEVGGWAVSEESRCTSAGLLLALAAYSLGRIFGGALGLTTATVRHSSATILKRLGGSALHADGVTLPAYFDPKYGCEMELLRFDSRRPNRRYALLVELLRCKLSQTAVIAATRQEAEVPVGALRLAEPAPEFAS